MRIIFMGTPQFAVPSLDILLKNNYDIAAVITVPDKKKGRGQQVSYSDVKKYAIEHNLPVLQPDSLKEVNFKTQILDLNPDLIIVVAFRILPKDIFTIPRLGSFNLHASLLPKYRGAAPINWAVINGEKETGVTTFFLQEKVDTGNIILQKRISINENDNAGTVHDKLSRLGAGTVLETVRLIEIGNVQPFKQDDSLASPAPKIFKEDCLINWDKPAENVFNFIRGLSPYPGAFTYLDGKNLKIYDSIVIDEKANGNAGIIEIRNKEMLVNTLDKKLQIVELQPEGKKRMSVKDFLNGVKEEPKRFSFNS